MAVDYKSIALITNTTYSYNNSSVFYSLVNSSFLPYYQRVVRQSQQWLDGYSPEFHREDMLSSRIGAKLINGLSRAVFGRGLIFAKGHGTETNDNKALDYISHKWSVESGFSNAVKQLIGYTLPMGTGALKLNKGSDGKLWVEPLRLDYFYYSVDGRKRLTEFTSFVRCFSTTENEEENYFMVEKRYFKTIKKPFTEEINGVKYEFKADQVVPVVCYKVYKYTGMVNNNTMPSSISGHSEDYKTLPDYVKQFLAKDYGYIMIDKDIPLPFKDYLGVELFFNEGGDITNPTLPVGRALLFDCLADFCEYDMAKSYSVRDLYNSKGIVGIPRNLVQSDLAVPCTGGNLMNNNGVFTQLNIPGYEQVPGLDPNTQKPVITQFEMRAVEHENKQNSILRSIALTIGVSPKTIASFLTTTTQATDDQIQSEDDTITQWVKDHRQDYTEGLNRIVECVLNYNGESGNVDVKFASDGLLKGDKQLENIQKRLELGMLTIDDAIREYYPDEDEQQLQHRIDLAHQQEQLKQQQEQEQLLNQFGEFQDGDFQ